MPKRKKFDSHYSPYDAALFASEDGAGWWLETGSGGDTRAWNVFQFNAEWVLAESDLDEGPKWRRWEDFGPVAVMLDGCVVGVDI